MNTNDEKHAPGGNRGHRSDAEFLPYGRQWIDEEDIQAVIDVLRSDYLTTGPAVDRFETAFMAATEATEAVAVSSGTAALHAAMNAFEIGPQDEVIVPAMTFVATANAVLYLGGTPVFADVQAGSLLIDSSDVERKITPRTKGIIAVDYAGQPCDYAALREVASRHGLFLLADACHSLGASYGGTAVGALADASVFSLHPVKAIAGGEGGVFVTNDRALADRVRRFRNHGIDRDHRQRVDSQSWVYDVTQLGFNYRLSDIHCALAASQLRKLPAWISKRQDIASTYDVALGELESVRPLERLAHRTHALHLYVVRVGYEGSSLRDDLFRRLRARRIGANVHYVPVYLHPLYRELGYAPGLCPEAEQAYDQILSLPIFPKMSVADIDAVVTEIEQARQVLKVVT